MLPQLGKCLAQIYKPNLKNGIHSQEVMGIVCIHQPDEKLEQITAKCSKDTGFLFF